MTTYVHRDLNRQLIKENITDIFYNYKLNIIFQYYKKEWFHTNLFLFVLISSWT